MATTPDSAEGYRAFHAPRFTYLADLVAAHLRPGGRVLDIGLSPFTRILRSRVNAPIDTLGLELTSAMAGDRHVPFDLNALADGLAPQPPLPAYSVIVFAEVLEHLHVAPIVPLRFLREHLEPGGVLIVQTPNAASLGKRVKLLAGRNPYELIREDRGNPGHFREYTLAELQEFARQASLAVAAVDRRYYFDARFAHHGVDGTAVAERPVLGAIKNAVYSALPPFLREGLTVVMRKDA
jgi:trans-aconitate methyltransferase